MSFDGEQRGPPARGYIRGYLLWWASHCYGTDDRAGLLAVNTRRICKPILNYRLDRNEKNRQLGLLK